MTNVKLEISDIGYFLKASSEKALNAKENQIRENILGQILNLEEEYFTDPVYGLHWQNIKSKFATIINSLCVDFEFTNVNIKNMGGMKYNYDFEVSYLQDKTIIKQVKLEFKHNNSELINLVQFLELYDKNLKNTYEFCDVSYSEHYYTHFLDEYIKLDAGITVEKPSIEEYCKEVSKIDYCNPFIGNLYSNKDINKTEKNKVVKQSIKTYLETYRTQFNFKQITEKIRESQMNKMFLLWDCENFHIRQLDLETINITGIIEGTVTNLCFDVEVENFTYNIRVRFNWGNNQGVANPRWKFTFIKK